MAREGDLPRLLASVNPVHHVPDRMQLAFGGRRGPDWSPLVDLRGVIGFSSFGVLLYYAIANAAAYTQDTEHRRWPRPVQPRPCWLDPGRHACPWVSVVSGVAVFAVGIAGRRVATRRSSVDRLTLSSLADAGQPRGSDVLLADQALAAVGNTTTVRTPSSAAVTSSSATGHVCSSADPVPLPRHRHHPAMAHAQVGAGVRLHRPGQQRRPPRRSPGPAAAVAGILFGVLLLTAMTMIRLALSDDGWEVAAVRRGSPQR